MGSQQCSSCRDIQTSSSAYGMFQLLVEDNCQLALIRKSVLRGIVESAQLEKQLLKRKQIDCANIVKLHSYSITIDQYLLGVELKYEQKTMLWTTERKPSEAEIANLLLGVESAILELHRVGITHRLVNLDTILCQKSLYKLADASMVTFLTGLDLARQGDEGQFLSEKNLIVLNNEGTRPDYELEDDLFSLAMVVLVIVLGCAPKDLYSRSLGRTWLNQSRINAGLTLVEAHYDPWIGRKVRELLSGSLRSSVATNQDTPSKPSFDTACKPPL